MSYRELEARIRQDISQRVMASMDYLPRFSGGPLREIQLIRRHQRKSAKKIFKSTRAPSGSSIQLKQIEIVYLYELEDFSSVHKKLTKLFQNNKAIQDRLEKIIQTEARLDGLSWSNLGTVLSEPAKGIYASTPTRLKDLPPGIERIHISHYRILPSVAAIQFSFEAPESLAAEVRKEYDKLRFPEIISSSIRPTKLFKGYSMEYRADASEAIAKSISTFTDQFRAWVSRTLQLNNDIFQCRTVIPSYHLARGDKSGDLCTFCKENSAWLGQYGYDIYRDHNYNSDRIILSPDRKSASDFRIETLFYEEDSSDQMDSFDRTEITNGVAVHSSALAQAGNYRAQFEHARISALKYLKRSRRKLHRSASVVGKMNLTAQSSKRMATEIGHSQAWSFNIWGGLNALTSKNFNQTSTYPSDVLSSIKYNLEQVVKSSRMISPAIQEQIDADNISVMYTLQKRVFWLTIVSAVVAGVGLIGIWDKIRPLLSDFASQIAQLWA